MAQQERKDLKKPVYITAGIAAAAVLAAVIINSDFKGIDFDPGKYASSSVKTEDNVSFDGVIYSDGSGSDEDATGSHSEDESDTDDDLTPESDDEGITPEDGALDRAFASQSVAVGRVSDIPRTSALTQNVDAVMGAGRNTDGGIFAPTLTSSGGESIITAGGTQGGAALAAAGGGAAGASDTAQTSSGGGQVTAAQPDTSAAGGTTAATTADNNAQGSKGGEISQSKPAGGGSGENNGGGTTQGGGENSPDTPVTVSTAPPAAVETTAPTEQPTRRSGSGGGGSSGGGDNPSPNTPDTPSENKNPSDSTNVAPVSRPNQNGTPDSGSGTDDGGGSGSGSGGGHGTYEGTPVKITSEGSFFDLSVGQSMESIFSEPFGRAIRLVFSKGDMTLRDADTTASGLVISNLSTEKETDSAKATVTYTYNTTPYTLDINYSVTKWILGLHAVGSDRTISLTPDSELGISLSRYYTAFKRVNENFCGWRTEGGDEIYTDSIVMTSKAMDLYPVISMSAPDPDDVGEEYTLSGSTDVDLSKFEVCASCRKLVIGADVKYVSTEYIARIFPNLEEITVEDGNTVYSSEAGVLYCGTTLEAVPPKMTEITSFKEGVTEIGERAFETSSVSAVTLPETVTRIGKSAFLNASLDSLTITADNYVIEDEAFYSDTQTAAVKEIISETLYVASYSEKGLDFGEAKPTIVLPDSMYDRAYQYYLSTWGFAIDALYGDGTANEILTTATGAQDRNTISGGGVYSFFDKPDEYTLTSVNPDFEGVFTCDENTVEIAENAFYECDKITAVVFGAKLRTIDGDVITSLKNVNTITFKSDPPEVSDTFFENMDTSVLKIYIPADKYEEYSEKWSETIDSEYSDGTFESVFEIDNDSCETIDGAQYLRDENGLILLRILPEADKDFVPAEGTYKIADGAINLALDSLTIPDTVTTVGETAMGKNGSVDTVVVNAETVLDLASLGGCRLFVPLSMSESYEGATALAESYAAAADGLITADGILIYVPKAYAGELVLDSDVRAVYDGAAKGREGITSLTLGGAVVSIGADAFSGCELLESIDAEAATALLSAGDRAFYGCEKLGAVVMPESFKEVGSETFALCDSMDAFTAQNIEKIGSGAFYRCNSLSAFNSESGINLAAAGDGLEIGSRAFASCPLAETVTFSGDTAAVSEGLFEDCVNLSKIYGLENVTEIGKDAFRDTGLTCIVIPEGATSRIDSGAFADCAALNTVIVQSQLTYLATDFAEDGAQIVLAVTGDMSGIADVDADEMINNGRIYKTVYCADERSAAVFGEGNSQVLGGTLVTDSADGGIYTVSESGECSLVNAGGVKLKNFEMYTGKTVKTIESDAFGAATDVETAVITRSVDGIPDSLFAGHDKLTGVEFKGAGNSSDNNSAMYMGAHAFKDCTALKTAIVSLYFTDVGEGVFENCSSLTNATWSAKDVESIPDYTFSGCSSLTTLTLTSQALDSVKRIGAGVFRDCSSLYDISGVNSNVILPLLEEIDAEAFSGSGAKTIVLPESVLRVGDNAFSGCEELTAVEVRGSTPFDLGEYVFGETPGEAYFELGTVTKETYDIFCGKWSDVLESNYGEGAAARLIHYTEKESDTASTEAPAEKSTEKPTEDGGTAGGTETAAPSVVTTDAPSQTTAKPEATADAAPAASAKPAQESAAPAASAEPETDEAESAKGDKASSETAVSSETESAASAAKTENTKDASDAESDTEVETVTEESRSNQESDKSDASVAARSDTADDTTDAQTYTAPETAKEPETTETEAESEESK